MTVHKGAAIRSQQRAASFNLERIEISRTPKFPPGSTVIESYTESSPRQSIANGFFARSPYFISRGQAEQMAEVVYAVETLVSMPAFREAALSIAPAIARHDFGPRGVFFGYDFHLGEGHPQLIEINTNAGGALLNTLLAKEQRTYQPDPTSRAERPGAVERLEAVFFNMFGAEWHRQRGDEPLTSVAIVDYAPREQFLYPEFQLFQELFRSQGVVAVIASPEELSYRGGKLYCGSARIDLVYNRLTDFALEEAASGTLRDAFEDGAVVLTPHPRAHALYADKRILALLSDDDLLEVWDAPVPIREVLRTGVPRTRVVTPENCEELWSQRRKLFFKPTAGYGGKGAYRGDKITRRAWQDVVTGGYIAQEYAAPSSRRTLVEGELVDLKVDVRNYVYDGKVQLLAARMFQGQTTNFRTPGGGFASVVEVDDARSTMLSH